VLNTEAGPEGPASLPAHRGAGVILLQFYRHVSQRANAEFLGVMMAIVNVYIDGFNLYYGALKKTPYRWLDLGKLAEALLPSDTIQELHYFTARVSSRPYNPTAAHDQGLYIRALKTLPNLHIKYGQFTTHSVPMYLTNVDPPQKVWVDKTEEKGSDVNLASHLLRDAYGKRFEVAVIVTNDSDLAEPVRIVAQEIGLPAPKSPPVS
jgi:uncharacterized LabA/DUF88 family protein